MSVRVEVVELLGHETIVYGSIRGRRVATASTAPGIESLPPERAIVIARLDARRQPAVGETIKLGMSLEDVHLFDAMSGEPVAWSEPLASRHLADLRTVPMQQAERLETILEWLSGNGSVECRRHLGRAGRVGRHHPP